MRLRVSTILVTALLCLAPSASWADLASYSQDFEGLTPAPQQLPETSLGDDGWLLFVNVFDANGDFLYNYGNVFPAPNHGGAISAVVGGQGGLPQGAQQLSVFSDYNCCDLPNQGHGNGTDLVEMNVFINLIPSIPADDVGKTLTFSFDAKIGNLDGNTTAFAFIKTLDPANNFDTTNNITQQTDNIGDAWARFEIELVIDAGLEGQLLQVGFVNTASNFDGSGVFYDNLRVDLE